MDTSLDVPCTLGARIKDTREATRDVWGDRGLDDVLRRLDSEVRAAFTSESAPPKWVPERFFVAWMDAVWLGPCGRDSTTFAQWSNRVTHRGFGMAQRLLISFANPSAILRRADALWHGEHTHGKITVAPLDRQRVRLTLRDHPFTEREIARAALSEALRYIVVLCRASWAKERHELATDGALHVFLEWG